MKIIETTFEKLPTRCLVIGFEGENQRATVRIDCASVFAEYPNATPTLIVKPLFADAYPVVVDRNGTDVDWLITSEILSFTGDGEIQLVFYKDEVICKSAIAKIRVCRSLQVTGDMPDPVAQWIDDANRKLAEVDAQIVELEGMVDTATDAATRAEQSASTASTKAEQAAGSAATATAKATEATNAAGTATAKAAEAEQSALTATEKATAAAESERIATAKAGEATTAAGTATAKAEQATEAAQTATEKAGDASASARAAQESATDAASSATAASASETAAKASETAASTSATQAAQSAQTANTAAQTATQKAGEASQSASNAATFAGTATTKAGEAAESAQAASDAKTAVEQTAEQLADSLEQIAQNTQDIADHEQYAEATYATKTDLYKKADIIHNIASGAIASFPDGADGHLVDELKVSIEPVQEGSGDPSPDNVRPITGWDGVKVTQTGKNLFDINSVTLRKWIDSNDNITDNSSGCIGDFVPTNASGTVAVSYSGVRPYSCAVCEYDSNKQFLRRTLTLWNEGANNPFSVTLQAETRFIRTNISIPSGTITTEILDTLKVQTEFGTATDYEPYAGQTYSITLPTEAGTVYGGELTVNADGSGSLVVNRVADALTGQESMGAVDIYYAVANTHAHPIWTAANVFCSHFAQSGTNSVASGNASTSVWFRLDKTVADFATLEAFRSYIANQYTAGTPVTISYKLATPTTYTLTASQIRTLLGQNNIWADTGNVSVKYNADTKLYIDNKIAELVARIVNS